LSAKNEGSLSPLPIKTISSREVYRNPWTSVREDVIERADGVRGIYGVVDKDPACLIIPLETTHEGDFLTLVEQYRFTVGGRYMELPQGGWETADADPVEMARGELAEETGLRAERMTLLATLQIGYGVLNQRQYIFLAEGLTQRRATWWCIGSAWRSLRRCCWTAPSSTTARLRRGASTASGARAIPVRSNR
jgi:8-oxo-dGTP pyrophosphatase MutT (NUDIX family)